MKPVHTPYHGSTGEFEIGLGPLDVTGWLEVDGDLARYLAEKRAIYKNRPLQVFYEEENTLAAQQEVLEMVVSHVTDMHPQIYRLNGPKIDIGDTGFAVNLADETCSPLLRAAFLVQEDLVVMRKGEAGWHMAAASVSFPSSWNLPDKAGRVLEDIHAPVPGFGRGTRKAALIDRIFDNLHVDLPVQRFNWAFYDNDDLYHDGCSGEHFSNTSKSDVEYFLRVERQTLRKLRGSGDVLFTIRIHIDPLEKIRNRPDGDALIGSMIASIQSLSPEQCFYKGLEQERERLIRRLMKAREG